MKNEHLPRMNYQERVKLRHTYEEGEKKVSIVAPAGEIFSKAEINRLDFHRRIADSPNQSWQRSGEVRNL